MISMCKIRACICGPGVVFIVLALAACQSAPQRNHGLPPMTSMNVAQLWEPADPETYQAPYSIDLKNLHTLDKVLDRLQQQRLVYVGETHDRFDHHLNQLAVIKRWYADNPKLAIGMEMFQQPFQQALDDYIAGSTDEKTFLRAVQYYDRWRMDYRLYRPIIEFARANHIPVIALDVTDELRRKIGMQGIENLTPDDRAQVPAEIDRSNTEYRELMQAIFQLHPPVHGQMFERFMEVQLVRDEAMAQRIAEYLQQHKDSRMVVLAGGGHLVYGYGIPQRVTRRLPVASAIVLNDVTHEPRPELADYVLLPRPAGLPPAGRLGVMLDTSESGVVRITGMSHGSPAIAAGLHKDDIIAAIDTEATGDMTDVKFALAEKKPGDVVMVTVTRKSWLGKVKEMALPVTLY